MGENRLSKLKPLEATVLAESMSATLASDPGAFGVDERRREALETTGATLAQAVADLNSARALYHAAVTTQARRLADCVEAISGVARIVYANDALTPPLIQRLGLQARSTGRARLSPKSPHGLVAIPTADGRVELRWDRAGNAPATIFVVEASVDGGPWAIVRSTTRTRISLPGHAPGVPASFRVSATRNEVDSTPCAAVPIYVGARTLGRPASPASGRVPGPVQ